VRPDSDLLRGEGKGLTGKLPSMKREEVRKGTCWKGKAGVNAFRLEKKGEEKDKVIIMGKEWGEFQVQNSDA